MRQLRIKSELCRTDVIRTCEDEFSWSNQEKNSFPPGWINQTTQNYSASIRKAFQYQSGDQLDSYVYIAPHQTYSTGGFVYEFRGRLSELRQNLSELHRLGWIDNLTRAVFIQFSLYNPNVQLFTSVILLVELIPTGGVFPHTRFEPISFTGK